MPVTLTILNHGTSNSSEGDPHIIITQLEQWMQGPVGGLWMINQGVGSWQLNKEQRTVPGWTTLGGILWAKGIDDNVEKAVKFVKSKLKGGTTAADITVNLAGHSRGSITCFKIANALYENRATRCRVNIFAIDPVAGNLGSVNSHVYKDIALKCNVTSASMFLAETERRNAFRPYIDQFFLSDLPFHRMDTIPGNHGGINDLKDSHLHESADVVLHHAVKFLHAHGTAFGPALGNMLKSNAQLLTLYAQVMLDFQEYKKQGHKSEGNWFFPGGTSAGDRVANTKRADPPKRFGFIPRPEKDKFQGSALNNVRGLEHLAMSKQTRFFANADHKLLYRNAYPRSYQFLVLLEKDFEAAGVLAMTQTAEYAAESRMMSNIEQQYLNSWIGRAG